MCLEESSYKSEEMRRQNFHKWPVEFIDKNHLAAAGFHYINVEDVVCCAFCHVRLGQWKTEDNPFKEHKRWSLACAFINRLFVDNLLVGSYNEQYGHIRDVCGSSRGT